MPNVRPPATPPAEPTRVTLAAGTRLSRVHSKVFGPAQLNPTLADSHWDGGRFDATAADPYPYLYAGSDDECAVCETILRDVPLDEAEGRFIVRKSVAGRSLSRIRTTSALVLVTLCDGKDLARLGQGDTWLVSCPSAEYGFTRRWSQAIRRWAADAQGLVWRSRRDASKLAYVFFGDRIGEGTFEETDDGMPPAAGGLALEAGAGRDYLQAILGRYCATLAD